VTNCFLLLVKGHALILGTVDCKFESDAKKNHSPQRQTHVTNTSAGNHGFFRSTMRTNIFQSMQRTVVASVSKCISI
jgi:hypothetical protein